MKERPIIFSAQMVRAIIEGRKSQTRRAVKPVGRDDGFVLLDHGKGWWPYRSDDGESSMHTVRRGGKEYLDETPMDCPYGEPGDRLWVKETWASDGMGGARYYATDAVNDLRRKRPSIHMPRVFSRLTLEVTGVRVERLNDISEADALAEGVDCIKAGTPTERDAYRYLWEDINGPGSWAANPWVWVIEFRRLP